MRVSSPRKKRKVRGPKILLLPNRMECRAQADGVQGSGCEKICPKIQDVRGHMLTFGIYIYLYSLRFAHSNEIVLTQKVYSELIYIMWCIYLLPTLGDTTHNGSHFRTLSFQLNASHCFQNCKLFLF